MTGHPHRSPDRRCKTIDQWPAKDRDIWLAALRAGDVLENGGELSHRSASTILEYARGYGRWLTWLDCSGLLDGTVTPANRITPGRVRDYIQALARYNATITILNRLEQLKQASKVMESRQNWSWIGQIEASVRVRHQPARPKRHRVVGIGVLFDLGVDLMKRAESESTNRRYLMAYRDGLLIALLAARPLRLRQHRHACARPHRRTPGRVMVDRDRRRRNKDPATDRDALAATARDASRLLPLPGAPTSRNEGEARDTACRRRPLVVGNRRLTDDPRIGVPSDRRAHARGVRATDQSTLVSRLRCHQHCD